MAVLAALAAVTMVSACEFQYDIDPYTQYYGLDPDYTAYSQYDCQQNCCDDAYCTVWQYTDMPSGGMANCMKGTSYDYGDSGGVYWQGMEGRADNPGGDPGGDNPPPGGHLKRHKKDGGGFDGDIFLVMFGVSLSLYCVGGTFYGYKTGKSGVAALPNIGFWLSTAGLVKDGVSFSATGGVAQPAQPAKAYAIPVHAQHPVGGDAAGYPGAGETCAVVEVRGAAVGRTRSARKAAGGVTESLVTGKKKRVKKAYKPGDSQIVIDPVTGKKKRKIKKLKVPSSAPSNSLE